MLLLLYLLLLLLLVRAWMEHFVAFLFTLQLRQLVVAIAGLTLLIAIAMLPRIARCRRGPLDLRTIPDGFGKVFAIARTRP
uniref:Putative secreted peptide n=1 Tax=Anopheles braziliensis TaxID=58242 RepID=A0A2M3ZQH0_9DIPT